ncbi:hypothetical protein GGR57DRAFT_502313 [Xylariaceae sp. FL1272]|nr:hypothetical protein GGR57DRAFT_502313 [Xylariaceae sp. FL1272]
MASKFLKSHVATSFGAPLAADFIRASADMHHPDGFVCPQATCATCKKTSEHSYYDQRYRYWHPQSSWNGQVPQIHGAWPPARPQHLLAAGAKTGVSPKNSSLCSSAKLPDTKGPGRGS